MISKHKRSPGEVETQEKSERETKVRDGGVTYALRLGLVGDGGRTAGGGREAILDPYTTQHVQQYLSIRTFDVNTKTHTQAHMSDMHTHTHHKIRERRERERENRSRERERART